MSAPEPVVAHLENPQNVRNPPGWDTSSAVPATLFSNAHDIKCSGNTTFYCS